MATYEDIDVKIDTAMSNAEVHTLNILASNSDSSYYEPTYVDAHFYKFKQKDYIELNLDTTGEITIHYGYHTADDYIFVCVIKSNNARKVFEYNAIRNYFSLAKATTITIIGAADINKFYQKSVPWSKEVVQALHNTFKNEDYYLMEYKISEGSFGFLDCCLSTIKYQSITTAFANDVIIDATIKNDSALYSNDMISEPFASQIHEPDANIFIDLEKSKNVNIEDYNDLFVIDIDNLLYKNSNGSYETVCGTIEEPVVEIGFDYVGLNPSAYSYGYMHRYIYKTIIDGLYIGVQNEKLTPDNVERISYYDINKNKTFNVLRTGTDRRNKLIVAPPENAISDWFVNEVEPNLKGKCAISPDTKPTTSGDYLYKINGLGLTVRDAFYMVRSFVNKYYNGSSDFALTSCETLLNDEDSPKHLVKFAYN